MRLLIAEDEIYLAKLLKRSLKKDGYAVDYVTDGEAAERRIQINHKDYDLVILDLMMPKKDGFEVCRSIRDQGITTPVLVLTARFDIDDKVKALDAGADDYLVKPFSFKELQARIRALLRRPTPLVSVELEVQGIRLNSATRKVIHNEKEVPLTVKEFSLLEYLMRHPNQVLSRNQILDHLWGFDFDSFSNVVDVHVKNIRRKIGPKSRALESVRGIGYRIKA